jgi:transcriptional regulator with XRE-family HTH domain
MNTSRKTITPELLRQACKDLSLTVTAIAEGTGLSKAYVSEFRNETRNLTASQKAQLLAFVEQKYQEAGKDFPEVEDTSTTDLIKGLGGMLKNINRPMIVISEDIPAAQAKKVLAMIEGNNAKVAGIMATEFQTEKGLFSGPSFSEKTDNAIRELFALLALNAIGYSLLQGRNIARQVPKDFVPKTVGDWLSAYLTQSQLDGLLPVDDATEAEEVQQ